jgi:hypothetical protein
VAGAAVGALPVHDHRAGQDQPGDAAAGHPGQQHRGAQIVAGHVLRQVGQVHAQAHHRGVVHDDVDPTQDGGDHVLVPDIAEQHAIRHVPGSMGGWV